MRTDLATLLVAAIAAASLTVVLAATVPARVEPSAVRDARAQLARADADAGEVSDAAALLAATRDPSAGWLLVDRLRFTPGGPLADAIECALVDLLGPAPGDQPAWVAYSDLLLAADVPAPADYLADKAAILTGLGDPDWAPFLRAPADLDWRQVTGGGVGRDGILSLDDPRVIAAADATWLTPVDTVFGVELDGHARAYPRRLLVVHELVNDTLAGQPIAVSFCTLCGAAIPYGTEGVGELRTSGLLQRSNKLMYDVATESLFDQLLGVGVTGPKRGVQLPRLAVTTTSWGDWQAAHPQTTTLDRPPRPDRNLFGDPYTGDFLGGRDAGGPIFPVGDADPRLAEQTVVLGVETPRGAAAAFVADEARQALARGEQVAAAGVELTFSAGGLSARLLDGGPPLPAHEVFWFAWSQVRPDTEVWP